MAETPVTPENAELKTVELSPDQVSDVKFLLELELGKGLHQGYATRLNELFVQLTGHNSEAWDTREGKYTPDKKV